MNSFSRKIILPALLLTAGIPAGAQQTRMLTADKSNEYGLVYTLPVTALHVELTARRDVERRGPFFQYAKKYLGDASPVTADSERWALVGAEVSPFGVPDTEAQYLMQLKPGSITSICVAEDGMILAINTEAEGTPDFKKGLSPNHAAVSHINPAKEYLKYVGEDFLASQSTAKQAQMLAETLMEVREARISLTRGTADSMPADGKQLELMLTSLQQQEEALTAAFTGIRWSEPASMGVDAVPEEEGNTIIARLSATEGFVEADDLSGAPITLTIADVAEGSLPLDAKGEPKKLPKDAVIYNIPGSASVTLSAGTKKFYSQELDFAQFGTQFGLAPTLFSDKKDPYCATFNPVTGALVKVASLDK